MTTLYVLRHPQTTWNVEERYQGRLESPLSEEGWRQLALTVETFADRRLDVVYSSPMRRARRMAEAIALSSGVPLRVDERFTEIAQGPWEGLTLSEIRHSYPELLEEWYSRPDRVRFPGAESLADIRDRTCSALRDLFAEHRDAEVLLVTHAVVLQIVVAGTLGLHPRYIHRLGTSNAGITVLGGVTAPAEVRELNSTSHLAPRSHFASVTVPRKVSR